ncbi:UbiA prenyltransferase [Penicillium angulare]|uniref:UbiA prenyltransferase n=1 Tax=Penicillium angulare TaxID=116970 RepID=A0A9W9K0Q5_9EURO|nr:UbiA prenyltransferase [Penicillium angulare]
MGKQSCAPPQYSHPTRGILACLPSTWVPYAELIRLNKPTGVLNIHFPYLFGALYGVWLSGPRLEIGIVLARMLLLLATSFVLRSFGCAWNDFIDQDLDRQVKRSCLRPLARGAINNSNAIVYIIALYFAWLSLVVASLPKQGTHYWPFYLGPVTLLVLAYPFAKRVSHHAQVFLGVTLAWGIPIGATVMDADPLLLSSKEIGVSFRLGILAFMGAYVLWSVIHDTVYAFQDLQDDLRAGAKSMAVYYHSSSNARSLLIGCGLLMVLLQIAVGHLASAQWMYQILSSGGSGLVVGIMLWRVRLESPQDCEWWFKNGTRAWGLLVTIGLTMECVPRLRTLG